MQGGLVSEHEFEAYLNLLARTLKLSEAQRQQIAGELRHHLEERLAELIEQGHDRDAAILAALDEFGDANILASDLTLPSQRVKNKRILKKTFGIAVIAAAVVLGAFILMPAPTRTIPHTLRQAVAEAKVSNITMPYEGAPAIEIKTSVLVIDRDDLPEDKELRLSHSFLPVFELADLPVIELSESRLVPSTRNSFQVSSPRIITFDRQAATSVGCEQSADQDPITQANHNVARGLAISYLPAYDADDNKINLSIKLATEWTEAQPDHDHAQLPMAHHRHPGVGEWSPGWTSLSLQLELKNQEYVAILVPFSPEQIRYFYRGSPTPQMPLNPVSFLIVQAHVLTHQPDA